MAMLLLMMRMIPSSKSMILDMVICHVEVDTTLETRDNNGGHCDTTLDTTRTTDFVNRKSYLIIAGGGRVLIYRVSQKKVRFSLTANIPTIICSFATSEGCSGQPLISTFK